MRKEKPGKKFSFDTITEFDKHISQSIPNYDILFNSIVRLSDYFKDENNVIYDVGCSTGNLLRHLCREDLFKGEMIGLDISTNLLPDIKEAHNVSFLVQDLTKPSEFKNACIVYCMFILQFLPKKNRFPLVKAIYDGLAPGGAMFLCEKVYLDNGNFQDMFTSTYYDYKKESFTEKEIFDKERSLRTLLKPNTQAENANMLYNAGFKKRSMFWKYFQFEGILCIK